jgi:hypothetical protein
MFRLNRNKQKTHPNSLKESLFGYFSENLGFFRFVSIFYETVLFVSVVSIWVRNTETNQHFCLLFHETNRNKRETDLVLVCFGSNRNLFLFVSRTPYLECRNLHLLGENLILKHRVLGL